MSEDRWPRVKHLFEAAVDLSLSERSAFLSSAIVGDETLREEVEALKEQEARRTANLLQFAGCFTGDKDWESILGEIEEKRRTADKLAAT